jgi:pyruvate/2-oxoglutarate dehydrogenase complex dihydrolipoamide dehydrogenase (E3) component
LSETDIRKMGRNALIARPPTSGVARARAERDRRPHEDPVDPHTRRFLGASMLGIRHDEVIHTIIYPMYARATYPDVMRAMPIHSLRRRADPEHAEAARAAGVNLPADPTGRRLRAAGP